MLEREPTLDSKPFATQSSPWRRLLRPKDIGFYLMIALSWIGLIYSTYDLTSSRWYWHWLIPGFGIICISIEWHNVAPTLKARSVLVLRQVLYWGGVLALAYLIYALSSSNNALIDLFDVRQASFLLTFTLAISTYLAGLHHDWRLCVVAAFILSGGLVNVAFSNLAPMLIWVGLGIIVTYVVWTWAYGRWRRRKMGASPATP
ncbi:MAG: hypothetical protein KDJ54_00325 [Candidatus Competibacteraceae bacterium]|nr:hypothetical protein [Candidatus Competibacteraceae bacterium]